MHVKQILIGSMLFGLAACAPRTISLSAPTITPAPTQLPTAISTATALPTSTPTALPTSTATTPAMPSPTATRTPLLELQVIQQQAYSNTIAFTTTRGLTRTAVMRYLLYLPQNYTPDQAWPLILFLHGSSEGGEDVDQVRREGLPKLLETNPDFPFVVVSPQNPADVPWADNLPELNGLIDFIQAHYAIDPQRLSVTGLSMGGYGTWQLASLYPQRFAALVPIAGGYDYYRPGVPPRNICALKDVPMWVFHGERDTIVEVGRAQPLVEALQKCGGQVKFTLYPDANHRATWERAYHDPELYRWLAEQRHP
jgi:predicted peptidase